MFRSGHTKKLNIIHNKLRDRPFELKLDLRDIFRVYVMKTVFLGLLWRPMYAIPPISAKPFKFLRYHSFTLPNDIYNKNVSRVQYIHRMCPLHGNNIAIIKKMIRTITSTWSLKT